MNTIYILGGPPRTAKSTIMSNVASERHITYLAADAIEHGIRNILTNEPHQMLRGVEFTGIAEHKTSITEGGDKKTFSYKGTGSDLTLQAIVGMLDYYRRTSESVAFEGAVLTPKWAKGLNIGDYMVRAAFVGYTDPAHADTIIEYAKANPSDWINGWLNNDGGDETNVRAWVSEQSAKCIELKSQARELGYPFFDISTMPFEQYIVSAQHYLLGSN